MFCSKCGKEIDDQSTICENCGCPIEEKKQSSENIPTAKMQDPKISTVNYKETVLKNSYIIKLIANMLGVLTGIASIISGIIVKLSYTGLYVSSTSYGGDAYTGIQNAAADTGNNVAFLCQVVQKGFCAILIIFGLAIICFFIQRIISIIESEKA